MKGPQEVHQWSKVGAFLGMTAVALGAYGAHGLKATPKLVDSWKTAAQVRASLPHLWPRHYVLSFVSRFREGGGPTLIRVSTYQMAH